MCRKVAENARGNRLAVLEWQRLLLAGRPVDLIVSDAMWLTFHLRDSIAVSQFVLKFPEDYAPPRQMSIFIFRARTKTEKRPQRPTRFNSIFV